MILFFAYRDWAIEIYKKISQEFDDCVLFSSEDTDIEDVAKKLQPSLIFFVGWSWMVPKSVTDNYLCLCLHPSDLPKYRGGSPIQNQIIDGIKTTKLTLFRMTDQMDAGPIYLQRDLNLGLEYGLENIFRWLILEGSDLIHWCITDKQKEDNHKGKLEFTAQDESQATYCKRRKPSDSEIKDFTQQTAEYWLRFIGCLADPYPNAYVVCKNGTKLYLDKAHL